MLRHYYTVLLCTTVQAGWKDGGVGRCQTVAKQFGDPPPKGWAYDTQPGLSGSLAFNATVSLEIYLRSYGCSEVSWGLPGDCYAAIRCVNLAPWSDYHSYVTDIPGPNEELTGTIVDFWDTDKPASHLNGTGYEEYLFRDRMLKILD
eukprot:gene24887-27605_t